MKNVFRLCLMSLALMIGSANEGFAQGSCGCENSTCDYTCGGMAMCNGSCSSGGGTGGTCMCGDTMCTPGGATCACTMSTSCTCNDGGMSGGCSCGGMSCWCTDGSPCGGSAGSCGGIGGMNCGCGCGSESCSSACGATPAESCPNYFNSSGYCGSEVRYEYSDMDYSLHIYSEGTMSYNGTIEYFPWTYPSMTTSTIQSVTIDEGITGIADGNYENAMYNGCFSNFSMLNSLSLPSTLTSIGSYAFYYATGTTLKMTLPNLVSYIGESAFQGCQFESTDLTIPSTTTRIGGSAFANTNISKVIFAGCTIGDMGSYVFDSNVTEVDVYANTSISSYNPYSSPLGNISNAILTTDVKPSTLGVSVSGTDGSRYYSWLGGSFKTMNGYNPNALAITAKSNLNVTVGDETVTSAAYGKTVKISIADGYTLKEETEISVKDVYGTNINVNVSEDDYTFTMPMLPVTITATVEKTVNGSTLETDGTQVTLTKVAAAAVSEGKITVDNSVTTIADDAFAGVADDVTVIDLSDTQINTR